MHSKILLFTFSALILFAEPKVSHASGDWIKVSKAGAELKRERRNGKIASSLKCRNNPATTNRLDPQIKFTWKTNTSDTEWVALIFGGVNNWKPGAQPGQEKQWKRLSRNRFAASSGADFSCSLWYHKSLKISQSKSTKAIHAKTQGGYRTVTVRQ